MKEIKFIAPDTINHFTISVDSAGTRFDVFLVEKFPAYSRTYFQKLIKNSLGTVNGIVAKASHVLEENDVVAITFPPAPNRKEVKKTIDDLGAKFIGEHPHFFIVYKPMGLSMHASHKHDISATLVDWLLEQYSDLESVGHEERPGIVHRLDKYTSGIVIVPRNNYAHAIFTEKFRNREIEKTYLAVVCGLPPQQGVIDLSIGHHPSHKKMMALSHGSHLGRSAETAYRVLEYLKDAALVEVKPKTGRTHQIRVHFSAIGHPLVGDVVYGSLSELILRQALHAYSLSFEYGGERYMFTYEPPEDFKHAVAALRI